MRVFLCSAVRWRRTHLEQTFLLLLDGSENSNPWTFSAGKYLGIFLTALVRINVTLRRVHQIIVAVGKQYYIFWVFADLVIHHAKHKRRRLSGSYRISLHYLTHGTIVGKKSFLNIKCMSWFPPQISSETFLILKRTERGTIINAHRSLCQVPVIRVRF